MGFYRAFTLFELMIVVFIISIVYFFTLSNFSVISTKNEKVTLSELKQLLKSYEYSSDVAMRCFEECKECFIYVDGTKGKRIDGFFKQEPKFYHYSKELLELEFPRYKVDDIEEVDVCFEFTLRRGYLTKEMIVQNGNRVYLFNNIYQKPVIFKNLVAVEEYFEEARDKVRDAF
jgi:prepilin-type N-terminal cleavage/methylation domain-containing protein